MKNRKFILPAISIIFAILSLTSCLIMLGTASSYEVWVYNDSTASVDEWIVVDKDSDSDGKKNISGNESCYYNPNSFYIPTYKEKGISGVPSNKWYYVYLTFEDISKVYYSDDFYLSSDKTVSAYYGTVKGRSALTENNEQTLYLKDSDGNIYQLHELKDPVNLENLKGTILPEAEK